MSFYLSKILWFFINPFNLLILLFILIITLLFFFKKNKIIYFFLILNIFSFIIFAIFPFGNYLIFKLEKNYHSQFDFPNKIDGILILGGATNPYLSKEYNQINLNGSAERLVESVKLIKKYKNAKIIFSGGSGSINEPQLDHAKVAKKFFSQMGIDSNLIIFENKSRNTYENILFSKKIVAPKKNEKWIVVTSAFHMNRAIFIAEKYNWELTPYAVDFTQSKKLFLRPNLNLLGNINTLQHGSHEWIGLIAYYLMGRTSRIL